MGNSQIQASLLSGTAVRHGFGGAKLHALQIGLGTFATFVQNLAGAKNDFDSMVDRLLRTTTEMRPEHFRGVAVEPVHEHILSLQPFLSQLPGVRLVQTAIGETDNEGQIYVLTEGAHAALLAQVPQCRREELAQELIFLRNMSSVGSLHPELSQRRKSIWLDYGVDASMEPLRTDIWSYSRLAEDCDFCGCELLMVDAEGYDAEILRSMIRHCREKESESRCAWPDVIVFESMGHCDRKEGSGAEAAIVRQLESCGYSTFSSSWLNTEMIRTSLATDPRLRQWALEMQCDRCKQRGNWPFTGLARGDFCCRSCYAQAIQAKSV